MKITETTPQIKEVKAINFLFFRTETTVDQLSTVIPVAKELFKEAVKLDLQITGPVHWHYFGFTGDVTKPFTLEIALPVNEIIKNYDGKFHFKRTDKFSCVSLIHEGAWMDIPEAYGVLIKFLQESNIQPSGINRELYINADFSHPEANITEIQMGITK